VDFDYMSRKEIIKVPVNAGVSGVLQPSPPAPLPQAGEGRTAGAFSIPIPLAGEGGQGPGAGTLEDRWTGGYIFENEWQSFRTRRSRDLELTTAQHSYDRPGRYTVAVKVIDIFGNDTMTLVPVNVG
jgi:site-specific DNA-methyltransferase (adenine-specific)/adenine-specific DNA-methyltransferase